MRIDLTGLPLAAAPEPAQKEEPFAEAERQARMRHQALDAWLNDDVAFLSGLIREQERLDSAEAERPPSALLDDLRALQSLGSVGAPGIADTLGGLASAVAASDDPLRRERLGDAARHAIGLHASGLLPGAADAEGLAAHYDRSLSRAQAERVALEMPALAVLMLRDGMLFPGLSAAERLRHTEAAETRLRETSVRPAEGDAMPAGTAVDPIVPEVAPPLQLAQTNAAPQSARGEGGQTVILHTDRSEQVRAGGSRAWRNNNPGNLVSGPFARDHGAIGAAGGFAVFPDEATGAAALRARLQTDPFPQMSLRDAIEAFAPPRDNDTAAYQRFVERVTGLSLDVRLETLSEAQMDVLQSTIRRFEGWREGQVTWRRVQRRT